jgi:hypothetical protein
MDHFRAAAGFFVLHHSPTLNHACRSSDHSIRHGAGRVAGDDADAARAAELADFYILLVRAFAHGGGVDVVRGFVVAHGVVAIEHAVALSVYRFVFADFDWVHAWDFWVCPAVDE